jgi:hypothetical protein
MKASKVMVKKEAPKTVAKTVKAVEEKKAAPVAKKEAPVAEKKEAPVEKKAAPAEKKAAPAAKKEAPAAPKTDVTIEVFGKQIVAKDILKKAQKAFEASHKDVAVKTLELYVKPEENVAYYVVNGKGSDDFKVEL